MNDRATNLYSHGGSAREQTGHVVILIGAALGLGAAEPGCAEGPDTVRRCQPELLMLNEGVQAGWGDILRVDQHKIDSDVATIASFCHQLANSVQKTINNGQHFIVLGGDHSSAIGTWTGAARALANSGPIGLIWIDAHLDAHTPETSPSGCVHGMPVATLLGYGNPLLTNLTRPEAKLFPEHLCIIGVRHYEQQELDLMNTLGVQVIFMDEVHQYGFDTALDKAIAIASTGTAGFGISIDLDALNPNDAPAVGTPVPDGISATQLINAIAGLNTSHNLIGYEIAEFNPKLDINARTARVICDLLVATVANDAFKDRTLSMSEVS